MSDRHNFAFFSEPKCDWRFNTAGMILKFSGSAQKLMAVSWTAEVMEEPLIVWTPVFSVQSSLTEYWEDSMSFRWINLRELGSRVPNQLWISVLPLLPVFNSEQEINSALEMPQCLRKSQQDVFFPSNFLLPGTGIRFLSQGCGVNSDY